MTKVTIYQTPNCVQCRQTKKVLESKQIVFDVIDLSQHPEEMEMVKSLGYAQAPVVITTDKYGKTDHWSGFRLTKLENLARKIHGDNRA